MPWVLLRSQEAIRQFPLAARVLPSGIIRSHRATWPMRKVLTALRWVILPTHRLQGPSRLALPIQLTLTTLPGRRLPMRRMRLHSVQTLLRMPTQQTAWRLARTLKRRAIVQLPLEMAQRPPPKVWPLAMRVQAMKALPWVWVTAQLPGVEGLRSVAERYRIKPLIRT